MDTASINGKSSKSDWNLKKSAPGHAKRMLAVLVEVEEYDLNTNSAHIILPETEERASIPLDNVICAVPSS